MCILCKLQDAKVTEYEVYNQVAKLASLTHTLLAMVNAMAEAALADELAEAKDIAAKMQQPLNQLVGQVNADGIMPNPDATIQYIDPMTRPMVEEVLAGFRAEGIRAAVAAARRGMH